jgi:hypothetical protein
MTMPPPVPRGNNRVPAHTRPAVRMDNWVSLGCQSHELEPDEAKSLCTSDVRYSGATASAVMGGVGLDLRHDPLTLDGGRQLWLSDGAAYVTSPHRDDAEVTISEAAISGVSQRETIERTRIERFDLSLDAVLRARPKSCWAESACYDTPVLPGAWRPWPCGPIPPAASISARARATQAI